MFVKFHRKESKSDRDLILSYKKSGDQELIGILFERYTHLVFGVCLKYVKEEPLAHDLTLEVFELLLDKLTVHDVENFRSWLYQVTRNHCLMYLRKQKSRQKKMEAYEDHTRHMEKSYSLHPINDNREKEETLDELDEAIKELKPAQQQCIRMFYLENYSYQEITKETGFTLKEVKSHIQNGKRNLKIHLEKDNE